MKQLAIIKNVKFGKQERLKGLVLYFIAESLEGSSGQAVDYVTLKDFMEKNYIEDIGWFEGKPCVVDVEDRICRFIEFKS